MAQYMKPANYNNMINALQTYARQVSETVEKLYAISAACKQVLGDEDIIANNLDPNIQKIANHYYRAAEDARSIAVAMQQELEEYYAKIEREMKADESFDD
jgi:hypothetical protein